MEMFVLAFDVLKGCFEVAKVIRDFAKGATFLKDRCEQLTEHVEDVMQPLEPLQHRQMDQETSKVLNKFLSKLSEILTECQELIFKCRSMGKLTASFRSLTPKASYIDKFNRLEKKLERMNLPASLVNMVSSRVFPDEIL